jgi:homoserine O-acetyltransferase/O-succinyltransferase
LSLASEQFPHTAVIEGTCQLAGRLALHHGGSLDQPQIAWRLAGAADAPVVACLGGISGDRCVFDAENPRNGWWREVVGPGLALDTRRLRVLGIDYLGGSGNSSGPTSGGMFPSLSTYDQAQALSQLLKNLKIERLRAIVGASYGAMVALAFGERHAPQVERLMLISGSDRAHPMATAWRSVQRRLVRFAIAGGRAAEGLELARGLAMATYRSPAEFGQRFAGQPRHEDGRFVFPVEEYLFARGRDYAARYLPESFLCLSESIDLHAVDAARVSTPCSVVAVLEDQLVPLADLRALAARLPRAQLHELSSLCGHDAFLKEAASLQPIFEILY